MCFFVLGWRIETYQKKDACPALLLLYLPREQKALAHSGDLVLLAFARPPRPSRTWTFRLQPPAHGTAERPTSRYH